jgi:hypothetical protein
MLSFFRATASAGLGFALLLVGGSMIKLAAIAIVGLSAVFSASSPDQWSATLKPSNGSTVSGSATADGVGSADSTLVKISIQGAPPNASLPWHIHNGKCGATTAVIGGEASYPKLQTSSSGTAEGTATIAVRPVKAGAYAVQVHRGTATPAKPGADVIACGDLNPVLNKKPTD